MAFLRIRRPQCSLRTMLIAVTVAAGVAAYGGHRWRTTRLEHLADTFERQLAEQRYPDADATWQFAAALYPDLHAQHLTPRLMNRFNSLVVEQRFDEAEDVLVLTERFCAHDSSLGEKRWMVEWLAEAKRRGHRVPQYLGLAVALGLLEPSVFEKAIKTDGEIHNDEVIWRWDCRQGTALFPLGKTGRVASGVEHKELTELIELLSDKDRFVAAHYLLVMLTTDDSGDFIPDDWHGVETSVLSEGAEAFDASVEHRLKRYWTERLASVPANGSLH